MIIYESEGLTFDDVLLVPQFSDISSRAQVNISNESMAIPIYSANMDSVTGPDMAIKMAQLGGRGILHRYMTVSHTISSINFIRAHKGIVIPSIGVQEDDYHKFLQYINIGIDAICIDVAHGDSQSVIKMIERIRNDFPYLEIIAGNVATYPGALRLAKAGASTIKVGVGPGSMCTTRVVTGHGVPQLSAIMDAAKIKDGYKVHIIADGGIRNSGDIVKALAAGADSVMLGSLLAGTDEAPGQLSDGGGNMISQGYTGQKFKRFRGMASRAAQMDFRGKVNNNTPEGEDTLIPCKGPVENVIMDLVGGIRSGFSYSGSMTLKELQQFAQFMRITNNGYLEGTPHGVKK